MKNFKKVLLSGLFLLAAGTTLAQGKIKGKVIDGTTNTSLPGANVVVKGSKTGTSTDFDGKFVLNASTSSVTFTVSSVGFQSKTVTVNVNKDETKDIGTISLGSNNSDLEEVVVRSSIVDVAKDRKTPVAVSTIKAAEIQQKLGNQEFPEILVATPSVYVTKGGGGFGDGRINIRGFANENIAVMINGMPVNDMENGAVYWSNWAGLSDVTSAMQVQRGLGSSKLAIASVGGTINVLTKSSDLKEGGSVSASVSNNNYIKTLASYNTGIMKNGLSASVLLSRTAGSMYADGTNFEGHNYYFALGYKPNEKHDFQFTFTGAPQWHNQNFSSPISEYIKYGSLEEPNRRYNSNWGYLNNEQFTTARNFYSKPIMSINHDWKINDDMKLSTVIYGSWGRGGGTGVLGSINGSTIFTLPKSPAGLIQFDKVVSWNQGQAVAGFGANNTFPAGAGINRSNNGLTIRANINSHDWYGALSSFNHKINQNLNYTLGLDARYYYGFHPAVVTNYLGAKGYLERGDLNRPAGYVVNELYSTTPSFNPFVKAVGDSNSHVVNRNYDGEVKWLGGFGQLEYSNEKLSVFFQGSFSNQAYQRIDNWIVDGVTKQNGVIVNKETGFKSLTGYNAKVGANYNISETQNVYGNVGYYERQPFFTAVFPSNRQVLNPNLTNEKILSTELGYGLRLKNLKVNINLYRTEWKDRWQRRTTVNPNFAEFSGIAQEHLGAEFDANFKLNETFSFDAMFSYGDWKYKGQATGQEFDDNYNPTGGVETLNLDGVKVGDAAQTTASLGLNVQATKSVKFNALWRYADRLYSQFDVGAFYKMQLSNNNNLNFSVNVYNLLDTFYISEARSNRHVDSTTTQTYNGLDTRNQVYFGFGRTWNFGITYKF
jgi:outer membrane cobalamin receptor